METLLNEQTWIEKNKIRLIKIRRYLHQHPELGFQEFGTSRYLKKILSDAGYEIVANNAFGTGFYCEYGEKEGPVIAFRADLDALPIADRKIVEYKSLNDGVMHACGHDVHMSVVTGLALWLAEERPEIKGKVRFIYQPAEEVLNGGALKMIEGGAVNGVSALIGIHVLPTLEAGKIAVKSGTISAAVSLLDVEMKGKGGHTSRPEETQNLISIAAELIKAFENKSEEISREENSPYVLGFGEICAGDTFNVIPSKLKLRGSVRYLDTDKKEFVQNGFLEVVREISEKNKTEIEIKFPYFVPAVYNDEESTEFIIEAARKTLGRENVVLIEKSSMGSDDFGYYSKSVKTVFIRLGSAKEGVIDLHTSNFDVNENVIETGVKVLRGIVKNYFDI